VQLAAFCGSVGCGRLSASAAMRFLHPSECVMLSVLYLDQVL
jgi:hypothetical protein